MFDKKGIIPSEKVCKKMASSFPQLPLLCVASSHDLQYLWLTVAHGVPMEDVLRVDTCNRVGSVATYGSSSCLNYHPLPEISVYEFDAESKVVVGTHDFLGSASVYQW